MKDKRSSRKASVVRFVSNLETNRLNNLKSLVHLAQQLKLEGFGGIEWKDAVWTITGGRLLKHSSKSAEKVDLNFIYAPKIGGEPMAEQWSDAIKGLVMLRFHRDHQAAENQRNFITAAGYVAFEASKNGVSLFQLTPEYLDKACEKISSHYADSTAYNLHKAVAEFAAHCDANGLTNSLLSYKYARMRRPDSTGGVGHKRLDDPQTLVTENTKIVEPKVFKVIGELYQNIPKDHKYRFYVFILVLLAMLGRRFSEIALLPIQFLQKDEEGKAYLKYFPRKASKGDTYTPAKKLFIPTAVVNIVANVLEELHESCSRARATALEMQISSGPDLGFLLGIPSDKPLYKRDLQGLGISPKVLDKAGWIKSKGFAFHNDDEDRGAIGWYTTLEGVVKYCEKDFRTQSIEPIHIDEQGKKYYLKDMLLVRPLGLSSGAYAHWLASKCTHAMMTTFLRYFPDLAREYSSSSMEVDFTSHHFRHTLNTLLDEGGLTDLLQTEWFGRDNPRDTKAYQNSSREKRALLLRQDIKEGKVGGRLPEQLRKIPTHLRDAVLAARVKAVHDVGPGICVHDFIQTPCGRHLQCSAECDDYVWAKSDEGREEELKRTYAVTVVARATAERKSQEGKPKKSLDWLAHNDKKLNVLTQQLKDQGIEPFDPEEYIQRYSDE